MATFPLSDETHGGEDVSVYAVGPQVIPRVLSFSLNNNLKLGLTTGPSGDRGA